MLLLQEFLHTRVVKFFSSEYINFSDIFHRLDLYLSIIFVILFPLLALSSCMLTQQVDNGENVVITSLES